MDPESFAVFIPIVALCIPVAGIIFHGLEKIARLRVEEAKVKSGVLDGQSAAELAALREEMGDVRRELAEVQERLDFAERLLTSGRPPGEKA
jgi:Tfp pilus assembly protein PilO